VLEVVGKKRPLRGKIWSQIKSDKGKEKHSVIIHGEQREIKIRALEKDVPGVPDGEKRI